MSCGAPSPALGTAQRYSEWFDCNARTIGQDGFLGIADYVANSGVLAGVLTIFVAMIGYRLVLGGKLDLSDGVSWTVKVGIILALLVGWSAFQAVFYQLAISGPGELSTRLLAASGIPPDETALRAQRVYDALRLGLDGAYLTNAEGDAVAAQPSLPITAVLFLLATIGAVGGTKLLAGFLLAIAPIPIAMMLFGPGMGFFVGWLRALATASLSAVGLTISSLLCLLALESEVARMQTLAFGRPGMMDEQAPLAVAMLFILIALGIVYLSAKVSAGVAEHIWQSDAFGQRGPHTSSQSERAQIYTSSTQPGAGGSAETPSPISSGEIRTMRLVGAFERSDRIASDRPLLVATGSTASDGTGSPTSNDSPNSSGRRIASRRALGRRHRSAMKRDRKQ